MRTELAIPYQYPYQGLLSAPGNPTPGARGRAPAAARSTTEVDSHGRKPLLVLERCCRLSGTVADRARAPRTMGGAGELLGHLAELTAELFAKYHPPHNLSPQEGRRASGKVHPCPEAVPG